MAKKKDNSQLNWKRKKWHTIVAPATYGSIPIGETTVLEPDHIIGKTVEVNLMHLTRNMKKQNVNVKFKVTGLENAQGITRSHELYMQPASIKRLVRAGRDRIDESFIIKSNDEVYARIKPLFITYAHQTATTRTKVRRACVSYIRKYAAAKMLEDIFKDIVDGKLQKELSIKLKDTLRMRNCEIRSIEVIEDFSALKQKKLNKRDEREAKKIEQEEALAARLAEEKAELAEIRADELAEKQANEPKVETVPESDEIESQENTDEENAQEETIEADAPEAETEEKPIKKERVGNS